MSFAQKKTNIFGRFWLLPCCDVRLHHTTANLLILHLMHINNLNWEIWSCIQRGYISSMFNSVLVSVVYGVSQYSGQFKFPPIQIPAKKIPPVQIPASNFPASSFSRQAISRQFKIPPSKIPPGKIPPGKFPPVQIPARHFPANSNSRQDFVPVLKNSYLCKLLCYKKVKDSFEKHFPNTFHV